MPRNLGYFEKAIKQVSAWLNWVAIAAMLLMFVIINVDVVGAKVFRFPLPGSLEQISLLGLLTSALAVPFTHVLGGHVKIEFFLEKLGRRSHKIIYGIGSILALALFATITWQMIIFSGTIRAAGVITPSIRIPVFPFTFGVSLAFFIMFLLILAQFLRALREAGKQ